jgi:hypothetical protein
MKTKKLKLGLIALSLILIGLLLFILWWSFIADDLSIRIHYGDYITLSEQKPQSQRKEIAPRRLTSIDYENRQACIEVYNNDTGWEEFCMKEGGFSIAGNLVEVHPNSIKIFVHWSGFGRGRSLSQLWNWIWGELP